MNGINSQNTAQSIGAGANGLSCVLRVDAIQIALSKRVNEQNLESALLVGDIEAPQELALLQRLALQPVGILLVPHHGSQTSSTNGFIEARASMKPFVEEV